MARINIEDQLFTDGRFLQLSSKHGQIKALGMMVMAFRLAQTFWVKDRSKIPTETFLFNESFEDIIAVGLASQCDDGVYVNGSFEQFDWILKRSENGKKGGRPKAKANQDETKTKPKNNLEITKSEPTEKPQSQSQSQSLINNTPLPPSGDGVTFETKCEKIAEIWNDIAVEMGLPSVKQPLSDKRKRKMREPLKELPEINQWVKAISGIAASDFHLGKNDRRWKADFDWFFQSTKNNYLKMLELYENTKWADDGDEQAGIGSSEKPDEIPV